MQKNTKKYDILQIFHCAKKASYVQMQIFKTLEYAKNENYATCIFTP